jgi:tRNA G18 (ribose-2'-O)-methylase SpoU
VLANGVNFAENMRTAQKGSTVALTTVPAHTGGNPMGTLPVSHNTTPSKRGYFAIGIYGGKTPSNTGMLWRSAQSLGAAFIFTVGCRYLKYDRTDTTKASQHIPLIHFDSIDELKLAIPHGADLIGVELAESAEAINNFKHPERAVYLLGAEDHGLSNEALGACKRVVVLPGRYCLNVAVAGSLVMYDRWRGAR